MHSKPRHLLWDTRYHFYTEPSSVRFPLCPTALRRMSSGVRPPLCSGHSCLGGDEPLTAQGNGLARNCSQKAMKGETGCHMNTMLFNYKVTPPPPAAPWKEGQQTGQHIPIMLIHLVNINFFYSEIKESLYPHSTPETTVHLRAVASTTGETGFPLVKIDFHKNNSLEVVKCDFHCRLSKISVIALKKFSRRTEFIFSEETDEPPLFSSSLFPNHTEPVVGSLG